LALSLGTVEQFLWSSTHKLGWKGLGYKNKDLIESQLASQIALIWRFQWPYSPSMDEGSARPIH